MTVKAFIKNEEKKRSKEVEAAAPIPAETPVPIAEPSKSAVVVPSGEVDLSDVTPGITNGVVPTIEEADTSVLEPSAHVDVCIILCSTSYVMLILS